MKILFDECVDWRLLRDLPGHDARTVRQMGWDELLNGALLRLAEQQFDVLITTDKNMQFQQNITSFNIGVVVLHGRTSRLRDLRELVPTLLEVLPSVRRGEVRTIAWRSLA
jgi:predicted nuclease of predicted toxin-antitoxin system